MLRGAFRGVVIGSLAALVAAVQVMDVVRSVETREGADTSRADLFTAISIGDAP